MIPPPAPFVLAQSDFTLTETLNTPIKTEFNYSTYFDMINFIDTTLSKEQSIPIFQAFFMVLDKQSEQDCKVIIVERTLELVHEEEYVDQETLRVGDVFSEIPVLRVYRAPYNKTSDFWSLLSAVPGWMDDEFLIDVILEQD